jgi:hypothetical protein
LLGFGYDFEALSHSDNELSKAYQDLRKSNPIIQALRALVPYFFLLPLSSNRTFLKSAETVNRVSEQIIAEKRADIHGSQSTQKKPGGMEIDGMKMKNRDLISILIKNNEST